MRRKTALALETLALYSFNVKVINWTHDLSLLLFRVEQSWPSVHGNDKSVGCFRYQKRGYLILGRVGRRTRQGDIIYTC